jgi:hypothetical protein
MIREIQAPKRVPRKLAGRTRVFLAGSIENGKAENWQKEVIAIFNKIVPEAGHDELVILNPRRDDWDSSWKQSKDNEDFEEQVVWELEHLEIADYIIFYFSPGTISPISLYEFGKYGESGIVVCPEGYEKKGNIDIYCEQFDITTADSLEDAVKHICDAECWEREDF